MKTLLTLFVLFAALIPTFAQNDAEREEAKRVILGDKKKSSTSSRTSDRTVILGDDDRRVYESNRYPTTYGSTRNRQANQINREYDAKINSIRNNARLSRSEKERIIRQLESDRRHRLARLDDRNYKYNNRSDNDRYDTKKSKRHKSHNGNHYGWEKGKGNPHRGR